MPDQEVEIKVKQTSEGTALADAKKQAEELRRVGDFRESQGDLQGAKFARQDAARIEKEIATAKREGARADRESAAERRAAAVEERKAQSEAKLTRNGIVRIGAAAGVGAMVESLITDAFERQGIANRAATRVASDARSNALLGTFRGSAEQAFAGAESARQEVFDREENKKELARQKAQGTFSRAGDYALRGGAAGLLVGGVPGAIAGAVGGAVIGGVMGFMSGKRAEEENLRQQENAQKDEVEKEKKKKELFEQTTGQEIRAQKERIAGHFAEANALTMSQDAFKQYKALRKVTDEEGAREAVGLNLREKELGVMRGLGSLAGARDGRANLAALGSLGGGFSTGAAGEKLDRLINVVERGNETSGQKDFTRR